jgi:hypothetical protein
MERAFKIGCSVIFFDSHRVAHEAIVTNWFHGGPDGQTLAELQQKHDERMVTNSPENRGPLYMPCCNVVWASSDSTKTDPYGRQLERATSCAYGRQTGMTPFVGMCWCWPDEREEAEQLAAKAFAEAVAR